MQVTAETPHGDSTLSTYAGISGYFKYSPARNSARRCPSQSSFARVNAKTPTTWIGVFT